MTTEEYLMEQYPGRAYMRAGGILVDADKRPPPPFKVSLPPIVTPAALPAMLHGMESRLVERVEELIQTKFPATDPSDPDDYPETHLSKLPLNRAFSVHIWRNRDSICGGIATEARKFLIERGISAADLDRKTEALATSARKYLRKNQKK